MTPLHSAGLALLLTTPGVVDRVEGQVAVVEWDTDRWSDVPMGLLPAGTREGDTVFLLVVPDAPALASPRPAPPPDLIDLSLPSPGGVQPPSTPHAATPAAGAPHDHR